MQLHDFAAPARIILSHVLLPPSLPDCCCRFEQLLPMGSLIFKQDSAYFSYYSHLLQPFKHYVPFWQQVPEELLAQLEWAKANDDKAIAIGRAGQEFAQRYISRQARACYWWK
jgi:hypothetical protein